MFMLLSGTFLFSRSLQASVSFEMNYWSFCPHMDKQVLNVSFILTSKRLFYCYVWHKENTQWFLKLGIRGTFPPPTPPPTKYVHVSPSIGCSFKNIDLVYIQKNLKQVFKYLHKHGYTHVHSSTIRNTQKVGTTQTVIS